MGAVATRFVLLRRAGSAIGAESHALETLAAGYGARACAALAIAEPIRLWLQARGLVESGDPVLPMALNVLQTTWGRALVMQAAAALVALAAFALARRPRRGAWTVAFVATLATAITPAFMGHAIAGSQLRWLSVVGDALHVVSAGAWTGTLTVIALASLSLRERTAGGQTVGALVAAFHPLALWSAAMLLLTGVLAVLLRVEHLGALVGSGYGDVLFKKLVLVTAVAAFGAYHSRTAERRSRIGAVRSVSRTLLTEVAVAALVIAVTAVLVGTEPPSTST